MAEMDYLNDGPDDRPDESPERFRSLAVLAATEGGGELAPEPSPVKTPAQAKIDAVAAVTMTAYAKASELALTKDEDAALAVDFPDEAFRPGANGDDKLIYIEHPFLRDRLNQVIGRGQWALVRRSMWTEEFTTGKGGVGIRVYSEVMLMVRGCFVAEAVGEHTYYPSNAKVTYADAIEGSKTAAFRRCAKDFGIGLQAWKKGWCEGWWKRTNGKPQQQQPKQDAAAPQKEPAPQHADDVHAKLLKTAQENTTRGLGWFQSFWEKDLTKNQRGWLKDDLQALKAAALASEKKQGPADEKGDAYEGDGPYAK